MPKGGPRVGAGAPRGNDNRARGLAAKAAARAAMDAAVPVEGEARPKFRSAREFGLWALNAPDALVPIDLKVRAMQVLAPLEAKAEPKEDKPAAPVPSKYAPREVKGFRVVAGGGK